MHQYYLGIDVSKAYSDFVVFNYKKGPIERDFQTGDSFQAEDHLMSIAKKQVFAQMLANQKTQLLKRLESLLCTDNPEIIITYLGVYIS